MARRTTARQRESASGRDANRNRSGYGKLSTHCLEIEKIWGGKFMRVFREVQATAAAIQAGGSPEGSGAAPREKTTARRLAGALIALVLWGASGPLAAHPLRLSLSQFDYAPEQALLTVSLRLFLMDVREALVFDPDSDELALCQADEAPYAERLLLDYLERFFGLEANGEKMALNIERKRLMGEGQNEALEVVFEHRVAPPLETLEIRNAVFTDLFFDQSNIVYVHVGGSSDGLMFSKQTQTHRLEF